MSESERLQLVSSIEKARDARVLALVTGDRRNLKLTTPDDVPYIELLLKKSS